MTDNIQAIDDSFENESTQMAFTVTGSRSLDLLVDKSAEQVCDFLAHHIARKPQDLVVHVQRIKLAAEHDLQPVLKGALLDLFIALGTRGYDLRQRMLKLASGVLPEEYLQFLVDGLEEGVGASSVIQDAGVSVLCKSITGHVEFIQANTAGGDTSLDPLEQALADIEWSQLEAACEVLEEAIHAGDSSLEQQALLLDLYRKTNDQTRFSVIYSNMEKTAMYDQGAWQALASHFDLDH